MGVDFGTANIRVVVTDFLGKVLSFEKFPSATSKGKDSALQLVCDQVNAYCNKDAAIRAIGISHSGVINHEEGTVLFWPKVQGWERVPIKAILEQACAKPTLVGDSSRTMALADIVNLLNPQKIILGGAVPQVAQSLLMEPLMLSLRQRAFSYSVHDLEVVVSKLGEEAAAVGAALLVAEKVLEDELRRKVDR